MKILLTNDDGIESEGLTVLASALKKAGHDVFVVAPDRNNSAVSHKINMRDPLHCYDRSSEFGYAAYALTGSPADCVMFALSPLSIAPDLVLSGINNGMNLGSDCMYSGTVGAAQEGAQNNLPAIALSANYHCDRAFFEKAAAVVLEHLCEWYAYARRTRGALNINLPVKGEIKGMRLCRTAKHEYNARFDRNEDGSYNFHLSNDKLKVEQSEDNDYYLFHQGYVTVTPLLLDMTDHLLLKAWKS